MNLLATEQKPDRCFKIKTNHTLTRPPIIQIRSHPAMGHGQWHLVIVISISVRVCSKEWTEWNSSRARVSMVPNSVVTNITHQNTNWWKKCTLDELKWTHTIIKNYLKWQKPCVYLQPIIRGIIQMSSIFIYWLWAGPEMTSIVTPVNSNKRNPRASIAFAKLLNLHFNAESC